MATQGVVRMLFAGLVYLDENLVPQLDLASSYRVSDDYKTYTFFLRESHWSDGSPITAQDFEETWKAALTPAYFSANTNLFHFIKNAKKAYLGTLSIDQVGVRALDDKTLVVELEKPNPHFLNILINSIFSPVHKSNRYDRIDFKHLVSSGPFQLRKYLLQNQIILDKNPHYWNTAKIKLDELDYFIIRNQETALLMFEKKELDWLGDPLIKISADAIPDLQTKGLIHWVQIAGTQWLFFNTQKYPYNNAHIRKALSLAIDRHKILADIMHQDNPAPPLGLIPKILKKEKWHPWFKDNDVKSAKKHFAEGLKELGITAQEFPVITINYATNALWSKILQAIQQMWAENLGIQVKNEGTDSAIFIQNFSKQSFDIARMGWIMQYDDAINLLEIFKYKNIQPNNTGWENPDYIRHAEAIAFSSEEEKWEHVEAAEKIFFDEMPSIPLMDSSALYLQQPYVKGVRVNYLLHVDFRWASIEDT
jgi:oligopeptide transport system substrate-binding protein